MNMRFLIIGLLVGIAWLVVSWILIRKIKNRPKKTGLYAVTIVIFILCAGIFTGVQIVLPMARTAIHDNMPVVDKNLKDFDFIADLVIGKVDTSELEAKLNTVIGNIAFWLNIILALVLAVFLCVRIVQALKKPALN